MSLVLVGLDIGQLRDPTALAVMEKQEGPYVLRRLERLPLRTPYPKVVEHVRELVSRPQFKGCWLVVDATGVGRPVVDLLRQADLPCELIPVTITAGGSENWDASGWRVPKVNLVMSLVVVMQSRRLVASQDLPLAEVLIRELENFEVKATPAGHETYEAGREKEHDDLIFAASLACWAGESQHLLLPPLPTIEGPLVLNGPPLGKEETPLQRAARYFDDKDKWDWRASLRRW